MIRFVEDNWLGGKRIGGGSNDAIAGSLLDLTARPQVQPLLLDPNAATKSAHAPA